MQNTLWPKFPLYFWQNPFVKSRVPGQGEGSDWQFYFWYPWVPITQWNTKTSWCILISNFLFFCDGLVYMLKIQIKTLVCQSLPYFKYWVINQWKKILWRYTIQINLFPIGCFRNSLQGTKAIYSHRTVPGTDNGELLKYFHVPYMLFGEHHSRNRRGSANLHITISRGRQVCK